LIAASARIIASARRPSAGMSGLAIDTLLDPEADDAHHLRQRGPELLLARAADALLEGFEDAVLARPFHCQDEGKAEARDIAAVEVLEAGELLRRQGAEAGRRLFPPRGVRDFAGERRLASQVR